MKDDYYAYIFNHFTQIYHEFFLKIPYGGFGNYGDGGYALKNEFLNYNKFVLDGGGDIFFNILLFTCENNLYGRPADEIITLWKLENT
jgi:hypothetical protein